MRRIIRKQSCRTRRTPQSLTCARPPLLVAPTTAHISSSCSSAVVDVDMRQLSTRMHTISTPQSVMLSPFIANSDIAVKEKDVDGAFMGLLKAMSGLKTPSDGDHHSMFDQVKTVENKQESAMNSLGLTNIQERVDASSETNGITKVEAIHETNTPGGENAQSGKEMQTKQQLHISERIQQAMGAKNVKEVIHLLEEAKLNNALSDRMVGDVVIFLSYHDLRKSFEALKYLTRRSKDQNKLVELTVYRRVIDGISRAHNKNGNELRDLGEELYHHLRESFPRGTISVIYQHILLPALVCQLAKYKDVRVKRCAKHMLEYMIEEQLPVLRPEVYEAILTEACNDRVGHLPYHKLLTELVSRGYRPHPVCVQKLLTSHYPYEDSDAIYEILQAIKTLSEDSLDYIVDIGTLESISATTTKKNPDLNLLIWDLADIFQHQPTEAMFEDAILSLGSTMQDADAFKAMLSMENSGYLPSYTFMRQFALQLSHTKKRLTHARHLLTYNDQDQYRSVSAMNCLLLGCGMRKDLDTAFEVFEDFDKYNVPADENTYAFQMEAFVLNIRDRFASVEAADEDVEDILAIVDTFIESMDLACLDKSSQFIYGHMRLLCILNKVEDARTLLENAIADNIAVKPGSIVMIATGYLDKGDLSSAREVAKLFVPAGCGKAPTYLMNRIRQFEERQRTEVV